MARDPSRGCVLDARLGRVTAHTRDTWSAYRCDMSPVERDPERGRVVAAKLKALGVKGILVKAAEQGYITQLACKMPKCFCPEELGGVSYFEPVAESSDW